jgi:hypothetical protein
MLVLRVFQDFFAIIFWVPFRVFSCAWLLLVVMPFLTWVILIAFDEEMFKRMCK